MRLNFFWDLPYRLYQTITAYPWLSATLFAVILFAIVMGIIQKRKSL